MVDDKLAAMKVNIVKTRMNFLTFADGSRTGSPVSFGKVPDMTPEVYRAVIEQAHKHGLRVAAHLFYLEQARGLVNAGLDVIAHSIRDQDVDSAFIADLKRRNVGSRASRIAVTWACTSRAISTIDLRSASLTTNPASSRPSTSAATWI